jgi:hypothetical protein
MTEKEVLPKRCPRNAHGLVRRDGCGADDPKVISRCVEEASLADSLSRREANVAYQRCRAEGRKG